MTPLVISPERGPIPPGERMPSAQENVLAFLAEQKVRQSSFFPTLKHDKVLSFMATTSRAGSYGAVSVNRVHSLQAGPSPRELRVALAAPLAAQPGPGECVTVHLTRAEQYQGFQVKSLPVSGKATAEDLVQTSGDQLLVKGASLYTVHHSPYTLRYFESIPMAEVIDVVGPVRYALVCVGEMANLSPRFVFHQELRDGRLTLYHGDGLALKTFMNLRSNPRETRLVVDLETYAGFALRGAVEEFLPHQHPEAFDRICLGFTAGGWGKPSRVFRLTVDEIAPLSPVG
jgi:hypothetical protein